MNGFFVLGLMALFISMLIGWGIGKERGRGDAGALLGLLGPVGWIIAGLLPEEGLRCPMCLGVIHPLARRCKYCGEPLAPQIPSATGKDR